MWVSLVWIRYFDEVWLQVKIKWIKYVWHLFCLSHKCIEVVSPGPDSTPWCQWPRFLHFLVSPPPSACGLHVMVYNDCYCHSSAIPAIRKQDGPKRGINLTLAACPRSFPYHFFSHPVGPMLVMWPYLAAREAGKCDFILGGKVPGWNSWVLLQKEVGGNGYWRTTCSLCYNQFIICSPRGLNMLRAEGKVMSLWEGKSFL